jgi:hypothetical protein
MPQRKSRDSAMGGILTTRAATKMAGACGANLRSLVARLGLGSAGSRLGDNEILVRLAVGLELHLVLVEGEFDAGVDGNQGLVGRLLLADVVVGGGRADNVFLAEEFHALFVLIGFGATVNRRFRNNRAGLRLFAGLDKARSEQRRCAQWKGSFHGDSLKLAGAETSLQQFAMSQLDEL